MALRALAARPRSEAELRQYLAERTMANTQEIDVCITRLKELRFVNDPLFAHSYASFRAATRTLGRSRLARELAARKVPRETAAEALDSVYGESLEEELINRAIENRIRTRGRPTDRRSARRLFDHLARLGFDYDLIIRKMTALKASLED
jgi:regulatory protein